LQIKLPRGNQDSCERKGWIFKTVKGRKNGTPSWNSKKTRKKKPRFWGDQDIIRTDFKVPSKPLTLDLMETLDLFFRRACYHCNASYRKMKRTEVVEKV
jgi:hypothetical protein